jgi:hypothetical protein
MTYRPPYVQRRRPIGGGDYIMDTVPWLEVLVTEWDDMDGVDWLEYMEFGRCLAHTLYIDDWFR